ncbi:MAG: helix-turn-helix domain-containing protein [Syntrophobacteraceae bacterium]
MDTSSAPKLSTTRRGRLLTRNPLANLVPSNILALSGWFEFVKIQRNSVRIPLYGESLANLHLKINEFARLLGVDRVTVSRWENEHKNCFHPGSVVRVCHH